MQNITVSGHAISYPISHIDGPDTITTINVAVPNPHQATPIIYHVECWNQIGMEVKKVMVGDFITVKACDLEVNTFINQNGKPDAELILLAIDVDCSQIERSDDYVGLFE